MNLIEGVKIKNLKVNCDERGWLMEILRSDDEIFSKFGQVYATTAYPGVVKAWHYHKKQTDCLTCIHGMMKVVLYDGREDSKTYKEINEFFIGDRNPVVIKVPPKVFHGFKAIGNDIAYFLNVPDELYDYKNPDEYRLPPDTKEIDYDWGLIQGLKHG